MHLLRKFRIKYIQLLLFLNNIIMNKRNTKWYPISGIPPTQPLFLPCIVSSSPHQSHGKYCIVCNIRIRVMREFAEGVQDVESWVGNRDKPQCKRHRPPYDWLTVPQQVAKLPEGHLCTNVFSHGYESNTWNIRCRYISNPHIILINSVSKTASLEYNKEVISKTLLWICLIFPCGLLQPHSIWAKCKYV